MNTGYLKCFGSTYYIDPLKEGSIKVVQKEHVMQNHLMEARNPKGEEQDGKAIPTTDIREMKGKKTRQLCHDFISTNLTHWSIESMS